MTSYNFFHIRKTKKEKNNGKVICKKLEVKTKKQLSFDLPSLDILGETDKKASSSFCK